MLRVLILRTSFFTELGIDTSVQMIQIISDLDYVIWVPVSLVLRLT